MINLLEIEVSFEKLQRMLLAPVQLVLLLTGIRMKVFNHLSEPKSAEDVAKAISTHPKTTSLFLDGLAASDLLLKKKGLYQNSPIAQEFLVEDSSKCFLGQLFLIQGQLKPLTALKDLPKLIKEGPPPSSSPEFDLGNEELWYQAAVSYEVNYERAEAQQAVEIVSELPEFPSFKKMLDFAGGPGIIGIAIVAAHPNMRGVIYDQPKIVKVAESYIKEYGMEDRMEVLSGDYTRNPIGEEYDLIWASEAFDFVKDDLDPVMKKIYDALNPGGVLVSFHYELTHERTKPDIPALSDVLTRLINCDKGGLFDQWAIADSMLRIGFKSVRSCTVDTFRGPMDLDIGRK